MLHAKSVRSFRHISSPNHVLQAQDKELMVVLPSLVAYCTIYNLFLTEFSDGGCRVYLRQCHTLQCSGVALITRDVCPADPACTSNFREKFGKLKFKT